MTVTPMSAPRSNAGTVLRSEAVPTSGIHQLICVTGHGKGMASQTAEKPPLLIGRASAAEAVSFPDFPAVINNVSWMDTPR
jgi:hypothetical protein